MEPVYHSVLDPMVALGFAAARTSRIRLGVAVVNLPFVSPAVLAKQAATLDVLSGGRLDLGLASAGCRRSSRRRGAHGAPRRPRRGVHRRAARPVGRRGDRFSGEFYSVPAGRADPKPVQPGGPPVLLGGMARAALAGPGGSPTAG